MSNEREPRLNYKIYTDPSPLPSDIPPVDELGTTSAPLYSAAYFIGARCQPYNDDFMLCKEEAQGTGELDCLKEGRRVTRCAASVIKDLNAHCAESFKLHYECLNENNYRMSNCRKAETLFNNCVFENLKLKKEIPNAPEQIHLKQNTRFGPIFEDRPSSAAYDLAKKEGKI